MAWTEGHLNDRFEDYVTLEETLTLPDSEGASETTVNSSTIEYDLYGRKFLVQLEVTETSAGDGAVDAKLQASLDESNWTDVDASLSFDLDTSTSDVTVGFADVSDHESPYWRIRLFSDGTDTQDDADIKVTLSFLG